MESKEAQQTDGGSEDLAGPPAQTAPPEPIELDSEERDQTPASTVAVVIDPPNEPHPALSSPTPTPPEKTNPAPRNPTTQTPLLSPNPSSAALPPSSRLSITSQPKLLAATYGRRFSSDPELSQHLHSSSLPATAGHSQTGTPSHGSKNVAQPPDQLLEATLHPLAQMLRDRSQEVLSRAESEEKELMEEEEEEWSATGIIPAARISMDKNPTMIRSMTMFVSKIDAGIATMLTVAESFAVELPTLLLPDTTMVGAVVTMQVHRQPQAERVRLQQFLALQERIWKEFSRMPKVPEIQVETRTQTAVVLTWPKPLELYGTTLYRVEVYRDGELVRGGSVVVRLGEQRIRLSGLEANTDYQVYIRLVTSAGCTAPSNTLEFTTRTKTDLGGLCVCFDGFEPTGDLVLDPEKAELLADMQQLLDRLEGTHTDSVSLATTHLVCHPEGISSQQQARLAGKRTGNKYEQAVERNIPIVSYTWLFQSFEDGQAKPTADFYVRKYNAAGDVVGQVSAQSSAT